MDELKINPLTLKHMSRNNHLVINKNIHRTILALSLPGMASSVLQTFYQLIDAFWVGKLGSEALAALGGLSFILWAVMALATLSSIGITTLVAQNIGAGQTDKTNFSAGQGMLLNSLTAIIFGAVVLLFQHDFYNIMGFNQAVTDYAADYMNIVVFSLPFVYGFIGLEAVFRGIGDTTRPMIILAIALALNAILDPLLIMGWYGFPAMGIKGAALATAIAQALAVLIAYLFLRRKEFIPKISLQGKITIDFSIIRRILDIGSPIALGGFSFCIIYVFLTNIISKFGTEAIAAIGVCHRIEGIAWFACVGFSAAAAAMVGQAVGSDNLKLAKRSAWWVNGYGVGTLFFVSIIFYLFPVHLVRLFTSDPAVVKLGAEYLQIIALFEIFLALEVIMEGVFSGLGYTIPVMLISVPVTAMRVPIAWYLALKLKMGTDGIWWAIGGTTFFKGLLITLLFASGFWKNKLVDIKSTKTGGKFRWKTR
jgi:putative MATE family efflux protein